ncbi:FERM domain-containing protein 4A [Trichonephila clavipes]|nr:FERM domain-containing protein 4A [Trichonephila clavipes]
MSEGRRSQVVLLDERRLDIVIQSRLYAGELLDIVASHFNLKEKEYFGISFIDESGQHSWLQLDKRVLEHDFPKKSTSQGSTLILYFRIKYFVESITQLRDSATIEAFYLQTKSLIAKETGKLEDRARAGRPCLKEARAPCIAVKMEAIASEAPSGTSSAREAARQVGLPPPSSVRNILRQILQLYPYKLQ